MKIYQHFLRDFKLEKMKNDAKRKKFKKAVKTFVFYFRISKMIIKKKNVYAVFFN
jgi:hypothetical protein